MKFSWQKGRPDPIRRSPSSSLEPADPLTQRSAALAPGSLARRPSSPSHLHLRPSPPAIPSQGRPCNSARRPCALIRSLPIRAAGLTVQAAVEKLCSHPQSPPPWCFHGRSSPTRIRVLCRVHAGEQKLHNTQPWWWSPTWISSYSCHKKSLAVVDDAAAGRQDDRPYTRVRPDDEQLTERIGSKGVLIASR